MVMNLYTFNLFYCKTSEVKMGEVKLFSNSQVLKKQKNYSENELFINSGCFIDK